MSARQKGKPFVFGAQDVVTITKTSNGVDNAATLKAVIESINPQTRADKIEFKDGVGDVDGLIYVNENTALDIEFYISDTNTATSLAAQNTDIEPGDVITFDYASPDFAEIDDDSHKFIVDEVGKSVTRGDVRKMSLRMTEYSTDLSTEPA